MIKTTTPNEIILNVYNETSEESQKDFHTECLINAILSQERDELTDVKTSLDAMSFVPRQRSLDTILNYSSSFMRGQ